MMIDNDFYLLLDLAFDNPTEEQPGKLGNVQFFKDKGNWCYSLPVNQWNCLAIATDLCTILQDRMK